MLLYKYLLIIGCLMMLSIPVGAQEIQPQGESDTPAEPSQSQDSEVKESPAVFNTLTLPAFTTVNLIMLETIWSQNNQQGDEVVLALADDLVVDGKVLLLAGTPAIGEVTYTKAANEGLRGGQLVVEITNILVPYSEPIPLDGSITDKANANVGKVIARWALLGLGAKGEKGIIHVGAITEASTSEDQEIPVLTQEEMKAKVDDWYKQEVIKNFFGYSYIGSSTVGAAMRKLGYKVDKEMVSIQRNENDNKDYSYTINVEVSPGQVANFYFKPFDEAYSKKFNNLVAQNDLAKIIFKEMM
jgi:hypothetical protein